MSHLSTGEGWLYLAAVVDLATRKIIGWSRCDHMRTELSVGALILAAQWLGPAPGLSCYSDRGNQYAAEAYPRQLVNTGVSPSMSRAACCHDNGLIKIFFHTLKIQLVHQR